MGRAPWAEDRGSSSLSGHSRYNTVMIPQHNSKLIILQLNIIAWTPQRAAELHHVVGEFDPHIILVNSTGKTDDERVKLFGFDCYQKNVNSELNAGLAVMVKHGIRHKLIDDFIEDVLAVELTTTWGPCMVATLYQPPRRPYLPYQDVTRILRRSIPAYIIGDFNGRHPDLGHNNTNYMGRSIHQLIQGNIARFLGPDFNTIVPTKGRGKPDIVLANRHGTFNYHMRQGPLTSSDHLPLIVTLSTNPITVKVAPRLNLNRANWDDFKNYIHENLPELHDAQERRVGRDGVEGLVEEWYRVINEATNRYIPEVTRRTLPHPRWTQRMKDLQEAYRNLIHLHQNPLNWTRRSRELFSEIQQSLMIEAALESGRAWEKVVGGLMDIHKEPAEFWRRIRTLMGGSEPPTPYLIDNNNLKVYDVKEKEAVFRRHWSQVFKISDAENQDFDPTMERAVNHYIVEHERELTPHEVADLDRLDINNYLIKPIEVWEINVIIKQMRNKAPGESKINKTILLNLPPIAVHYLTLCFNLSLSMGYFPDRLKRAVVVLIPKPGKAKTLAANYRPISLLEIPGKMFERIMNNRITKHFENNNYVNDNQFGFRAGKGTGVALATLYERIAISQTLKEKCNVVSRDISSAFDKVWQIGLRYKLMQTNLPILIKKFLSSYVSCLSFCLSL